MKTILGFTIVILTSGCLSFLLSNGSIDRVTTTAEAATTTSNPWGTVEARPTEEDKNPEKCYESYKSYFSYKPHPSTLYEVSVTVTQIFETLQTFGAGSIYTACDGIARFRFTSSPTATIASTMHITQTQVIAMETHYEEIKSPVCSLNPDGKFCKGIWDSYMTNRTMSSENDVNFDDETSPLPLCQKPGFCRLDSGEEVILIYWPPTLSSRDICASNGYGAATTLTPEENTPNIVTTSAITFLGQDLYLRGVAEDGTTHWVDDLSAVFGLYTNSSRPMKTELWRYATTSVLTGPFTFTSPTIYLAHHPITGAREAMERISSSTMIIPAGIISLRTDDVYSMRQAGGDQRDGVHYAQQVARGEYTTDIRAPLTFVRPETVPFDFGHLQNPVPASIYYDASPEHCRADKQALCATITDDTYRPRIFIRNRVWQSLFPQWYDCSRPVLVDPPLALLPLETIQTPTIPVQPITTSQAGDIMALPSASPMPNIRSDVTPQTTGGRSEIAPETSNFQNKFPSASSTASSNNENGQMFRAGSDPIQNMSKGYCLVPPSVLATGFFFGTLWFLNMSIY